MSKILITGGTGSLGRKLTEKYINNGYNVTVLSRNPHKQEQLAEVVNNDKLRFFLCDICDYDQVASSCEGQDILIHAAALKTVGLGQKYPEEFFRVNVTGSRIVAKAWKATHLDNNSAILINTDKSVSPVNTYGCTKKIAEDIFINYGFSSLRYGNVVESEGSFIHYWKRRREEGLPIPVRVPHPTRFFLSMDQAIDLIEEALLLMSNGNQGIFAPHNLKSFDIYEVARAMTPDVNICQANYLQPGEKQHEVLIQEGEITARLGDNLSGVIPGRGDIPAAYKSDTAPRMAGGEVLDALNVSPLQEIFA